MHEIYVSTDIETTGPIPGPFSMISLGSVAYDGNGLIVDTFEVNLQQLPFAGMDPSTQKFWDNQPTAWDIATRNQVEPKVAMERYAQWLEALPGKPVFAAYPAGFDFTFVYWYLVFFAGRSPFSFSALDMKSYAMALLKTPFRETVKRRFPAEWHGPENPMPHCALSDAREQGDTFAKIMKHNGLGIDNAELKNWK